MQMKLPILTLLCLLLLAVAFTAGCTKKQRPLEDIDAIIARFERSKGTNEQVGTIVDRPQGKGPFRAVYGGGSVSGVGEKHGGAFTTEKGTKRTFEYPAVEGMYYIVYVLIDENDEVSFLTFLRPDSPMTKEDSGASVSAAE
jgi:hypothetical protein